LIIISEIESEGSEADSYQSHIMDLKTHLTDKVSKLESELKGNIVQILRMN
jgi:hypothetical protein